MTAVGPPGSRSPRGRARARLSAIWDTTRWRHTMSRRATLVQRLFMFLVLVPAVGFSAAPQPPPVSASDAALSAPEAQLRTVRFGSPGAVSDAGVFVGRERG